MPIVILLLFAGLGLACVSPSATEPEDPSTGRAVGLLAGLDRDVLRRPIDVATGIGVWPSTTNGQETVVERLDQGTAYLAAFEWVLAARAFNEALRLDPRLALAEIGLARAMLGLEARDLAQAHARRASEMATSAPPSNDRNAARFDVGMRQLAAIEAWDRGERAPYLQLRTTLDRHIDRHPDAVEFLLLRGHLDLRPDGWGQIPSVGALDWYRSALVVAPDHAGVHHALVHCLEGLGRHAEAVAHADRFAALAPEIPHAHHMRGHILPVVNRWADAKAALLEADRLHRARFDAGVLHRSEDWHFGHNLRLLAALYQRSGDHERAEAAYREASAIGYGGRRSGFYGLPVPLFLASRGRHDEALVAARECATLPSALARVVCTAAGGEASLALGDRDTARLALRESRGHLERFQTTRRPDVSEATFQHAASLAIDILDSKLARGEADTEVDARQLAIARGLCSGNSVDAWSMCQLRVGELIMDARRLGRVALADQLQALVAR